jgi:conjugal transfer pilus assembly protein TraB
MSDTGVIAKYKQQWQEMDPKFKWALGAIVVGGAILMAVKSREHDRYLEEEQARKIAHATAVANAQNSGKLPNSGNTFSALPASNRNQGLEDLLASLDKARADAKDAQERAKGMDEQLRKLNERFAQMETRGATSAGAPTGRANAGMVSTAYENLPPPVDFGQAGTGRAGAVDDKSPFSDAPLPAEARPVQTSRTAMRVWGEVAQPASSGKRQADGASPLTIPVNSALESVMLTGVNARSNAAGGAANGTVISANNVGTPFVSRLKGDAILPNGWKVSDFNDCFISGTGIAILSSERMNAISNVMSCVDKHGVVYEAKIKAYGVDLDGIQGISGRIVTKQGAVLAKTALAGIASGLGSALTPSAIPGYNQNTQSGSRVGIQYPNADLIAGSALGKGVADGMGALSKFYLDYAKELFPVIEVNAGTRITWILQESVELNLIKKVNQ